MKDLIEENKVQLITLAALIILPLFFLGMSGLKFMIVMAILYVLPVYLILTYFDIKQGERIFFSLFISLGLLSLGTFYLNLIIPCSNPWGGSHG